MHDECRFKFVQDRMDDRRILELPPPSPLPHPLTSLRLTRKNSAAPKRTAHSSPQNGGPKGKMIEGRSGGSGRGTRKESRAPPGSLGTSAIYEKRANRIPPSPPILLVSDLQYVTTN